MNTVLHQAASQASLGWLMGLNTVLFFCIFVGWSLYLYLPSRKQIFDDASRLPLED